MKTKLLFTFSILMVLALQASSKGIRISSVFDLQRIGNDVDYPLDGHYELTQDIDLANINFNSIGHNSIVQFSGIFDGRGHTIRGLYIARIGHNSQGLFRVLESGGEIKNLGLVDVDVTASYYVGSLVGILRGGTITNCYSTGSISGTNSIGNVGGLVGRMTSGTIIGSYTNVNLDGVNRVGGLVGEMFGGKIENSYSVVDLLHVGGFLSSRTSPYGGLIGSVTMGEIVNCYSTVISIRNIMGDGITGGLIGASELATVTNSYWDTETSGLTTSAGGEGRTTAQMNRQATFIGWDFDDIWQIDEGTGYPYLSALAHTSVIDNRITRNTAIKPAPLITVKGKTLNIKALPNSDLQIKLFDMRGKTLARFNTRGSNSFSLAKIPAGRYLVETRENGKRVGTTAVVLN